MIKHLQNVLHTEIPLTKAIGIEVKQFTDLSLTLSAPITNNLNHKCTAFGGSLYSVSVLSGWGLIYLALKQHQLSGHIVIQESNTKFIKPVEKDIIARAAFQSVEQRDKLLAMYRRKGIARITLESDILTDDNTIGVKFKGTYVVHR